MYVYIYIEYVSIHSNRSIRQGRGSRASAPPALPHHQKGRERERDYSGVEFRISGRQSKQIILWFTRTAVVPWRDLFATPPLVSHFQESETRMWYWAKKARSYVFWTMIMVENMGLNYVSCTSTKVAKVKSSTRQGRERFYTKRVSI